MRQEIKGIDNSVVVHELEKAIKRDIVSFRIRIHWFNIKSAVVKTHKMVSSHRSFVTYSMDSLELTESDEDIRLIYNACIVTVIIEWGCLYQTPLCVYM